MATGTQSLPLPLQERVERLQARNRKLHRKGCLTAVFLFLDLALRSCLAGGGVALALALARDSSNPRKTGQNVNGLAASRTRQARETQ